MTSHILAIQMPGLTEWIIIGALGLLIFGKRLPEVGKSLGKGIVEFKKGIKGLEDDVDTGSVGTPRQDPLPLEQPRPPQRVMTSAPKFEDSPNNITTPPKA